VGTFRIAAALAAALLSTAAGAQYPARPIRLLVPNPPGGASDTIARIVAPALSVALGQPLVVENRPGSNGNLSSELAAKAAPDGYTLLLGQDSQIVISPHLYPNLPVDTLKDLVPVATLITTQMVLAANASLPAKDLREFVELAKRAKPPLAYASIGNGSQHHLTMEMLKLRAGIELVHVPYKGGGPATNGAARGRGAGDVRRNSVTAHIKAGRLRGLAVAGKKRSAVFRSADARRVLPGARGHGLAGRVRALGVPAPVLSRLHEEINRLSPHPSCATRSSVWAAWSPSSPHARNSPR